MANLSTKANLSTNLSPIMETVLYVICSILIVMNFRHPLQAKFEGYLIILFLPPPPWVLESHR